MHLGLLPWSVSGRCCHQSALRRTLNEKLRGEGEGIAEPVSQQY